MSLVKNQNKVLFPSLLNEIFKNDLLGGVQNYGTSLPAVNILKQENGFELQIAIPGLNKDQIELQLDENVLTISSKKNEENIESQGNYTRREFNFSSFKRSFTLPDTLDQEQIKATHENGILTIQLPYKPAEEPKTKKIIAIM